MSDIGSVSAASDRSIRHDGEVQGSRVSLGARSVAVGAGADAYQCRMSDVATMSIASESERSVQPDLELLSLRTDDEPNDQVDGEPGDQQAGETDELAEEHAPLELSASIIEQLADFSLRNSMLAAPTDHLATDDQSETDSHSPESTRVRVNTVERRNSMAYI